MIRAPFSIEPKDSEGLIKYCEVTYTYENVRTFEEAIDQNMVFTVGLNSIIRSVPVGRKIEENYFITNQISFTIFGDPDNGIISFFEVDPAPNDVDDPIFLHEPGSSAQSKLNDKGQTNVPFRPVDYLKSGPPPVETPQEGANDETASHFKQSTPNHTPLTVKVMPDDQMSHGMTLLIPDTTISFFYTVKYEKTLLTDEDVEYLEMESIENSTAPERGIRWTALGLTSLTIACLSALIFYFVCSSLRMDLYRMLKTYDVDNIGSGDYDEFDFHFEESCRWKQLGGDVFRYPEYRTLGSAFLGAGAQLCVSALGILIYSSSVHYSYSYVARSGLVRAAIIIYMLSGIVGGYVSAKLYHELGGRRWTLTIIATGSAYSVPLFIGSLIHKLLTIGSDTVTGPTGWFWLKIFLGWLFGSFPLVFAGGIYGFRRSMSWEKENGGKLFPSKTNTLRKSIPRCRWYQTIHFQYMVSALSGCIGCLAESYYILNSIWTNRYITAYGTLFVSFTLVLVLMALITVCFTYVHLNAGEHRWWWRSALCGSSCAPIMLILGWWCTFVHMRHNGYGNGSMIYIAFVVCYITYAFALILATVCFFSSYYFVRLVYARLKID